VVRTQVQLTEQQYKALKAVAERRKVSMAELIRQGVEKVLSSSATLAADEQRKRALDIAGRFHSGKTDISEKHDDYLSEVGET
jgi:Arc/MetJ-type ribon-helix-helix transcriptional regulator